jgi:hypothetical protein
MNGNPTLGTASLLARLKLQSTFPADVCPTLLLGELTGEISNSAGQLAHYYLSLHISVHYPSFSLSHPPPADQQHAVCSSCLDCAPCAAKPASTSALSLLDLAARIYNGAVPRFGTSGRRSYRRRRGRVHLSLPRIYEHANT